MTKDKGNSEAKGDKEQLVKRVLEVKKKLPTGIIGLMIHKFPEYKDKKKQSRLNNVLQLRAVDEGITYHLEQLAIFLNTPIAKAKK